jgi:hypothetical protein
MTRSDRNPVTYSKHANGAKQRWLTCYASGKKRSKSLSYDLVGSGDNATGRSAVLIPSGQASRALPAPR